MHTLRKTIPSVLFLSALVGQALLWRGLPVAPGIPPFFSLLALPVFLAACWFPLAAAWSFRQARTTVFAYSEPEALVTKGVYRFTRNPMYVGMLLILISVALWANRWPLWIPVLIFVPIMNGSVIQWEERTLARKWPERFGHWAAQTPRWLLFRGGWKGPFTSGSGFPA